MTVVIVVVCALALWGLYTLGRMAYDVVNIIERGGR
jgi:hypothetical protein